MKRYETMSKEEILEFVAGCVDTNCQDCPANTAGDMLSAQCVAKYLTEEVPEPLMVRRYQNIRCKQDLTEGRRIVSQRCESMVCKDCKHFKQYTCQTLHFIDYLCELEPEREKEWYKDEKHNESRKA